MERPTREARVRTIAGPVPFHYPSLFSIQEAGEGMEAGDWYESQAKALRVDCRSKRSLSERFGLESWSEVFALLVVQAEAPF